MLIASSTHNANAPTRDFMVPPYGVSDDVSELRWAATDNSTGLFERILDGTSSRRQSSSAGRFLWMGRRGRRLWWRSTLRRCSGRGGSHGGCFFFVEKLRSIQQSASQRGIVACPARFIFRFAFEVGAHALHF